MRQIRKILFSGILSLLLLFGMLFSVNTIRVVQPVQVVANDISSNPAKGEVNGTGVYGYTTNYVCYGGTKETQHKVEDGWHITAKNMYYSYNITWYECWDTDDGDYYGWIDGTINEHINTVFVKMHKQIRQLPPKGQTCPHHLERSRK